MKGLKKLLTEILAATMIMGSSMTAFATDIGNTGDLSNGNPTTSQTGTVTITNAIVGEKYRGYKIFDASISSELNEGDAIAISYKWAGNGSMPENDYFEENANGYINAKEAAKGTDGKLTSGAIAKLKEWVDAGTYGFETTTETTATLPVGAQSAETMNLVFNVAYGYWYFTSSVGSVVSVDSSNPTAQITDKNQKPGSEKKVQEDGNSQWGDRNDADLTQVVNYKSTVTLKPGQKNVVFHDQMTSALELKNSENSPISVTVDKGSILASDYSVNYLNGTQPNDTFTVSFTENYLNNIKEETVVTISYSATLTSDAVIGKPADDFGNGNDNRSQITYGENSYTEWDWTRTYTWQFEIFKYTNGNENTKTPLKDAKFKLYYSNDTNKSNPLKFDAATDDKGVAVYKYNTNGTVVELVTPQSGKISIVGIDADIYKLEETEAPAGYNKLKDPISVTISSATEEQKDTNSDQVISAASIQKGEDVVTSVEVLNESGTLLPSTGGIGTTIFYVIGGLLIVAGVAYFIVRRKAEAE